jgi:hypothetical protein
MIKHRKQQNQTLSAISIFKNHPILSSVFIFMCMFIYADKCEIKFPLLKKADSWKINEVCALMAVVLSAFVFYYIKKKITFEKFGLKNLRAILLMFVLLVLYSCFLTFLLIRPSVLLFNGLLDKTEPQTHWAMISRKYVRHFKFLQSFYLKLNDSQSDSDYQDICVNRDFYDVANEGEELIMTTGQGKLGLEWIKNYELEKPR